MEPARARIPLKNHLYWYIIGTQYVNKMYCAGFNFIFKVYEILKLRTKSKPYFPQVHMGLLSMVLFYYKDINKEDKR